MELSALAKQKERRWRRISYLRNRDKILARGRAYYHQNKEKLQAQQRSYRDKNREKLLAQKRAYRETHKTERLDWLRKNRRKLRAYSRAYRRAYYKENRDRVLATQHSRYDAKRQFVTPEELEACRQDPRKAKAIAGPDLIVCLECGEKLNTLCRHLGQEHSMTADAYKRKPGPDGKIRRYDHKTNLMSVSFSTEISRKRKRWRQGRWVAKHRPPVEKLIASRGPRDWSLESRLNRRDWKQGITQRDQWKKHADGTVVEDLRIAQLRLQGKEILEICRRVGLSEMPVILRLRRMGFPRGRACLFQHGKPLTGRHVLTLCSDFGMTKKQIAERLTTSPELVSHHSTDEQRDKPLPVWLVKGVATIRGTLPKRTPSPSGGRPQGLSPSERKEMADRYSALRDDLWLLRDWLQTKDGEVETPEVWSWLCEQSRKRAIRTLLFWPEFLRWMEKNYGYFPSLRGGHSPSELAFRFLASDYHTSAKTIKRAFLKT